MDSKVRPIPEGYHSITPYIIVRDAKKAIEFYKNAFGAIETVKMEAPDGRISHCELRIGDSVIMLADEFPKMGAVAPTEQAGRAFSLLIYVNNVDDVFHQAVAAGAKVIRNLENQFYGDRMGTVQDPFGHNWHLAQQVENVSPEEIKRRSEKIWNEQHPQ